MNRRSFLAAIAAGFAPAVVGSGVLMPIRKLIVPEFAIGLPTMEQIIAVKQWEAAENMGLAKQRVAMMERFEMVTRYRATTGEVLRRYVIGRDGREIELPV